MAIIREFPVIEKLGGRENVRYRLARAGYKLGQRALGMWVTRSQIPGHITIEIMRFCEEDRIRFTAADFKLSTPAPPPRKRTERRAAA